MVLVTGAAGYIGSVMSLLLLERGYGVVGVDDLSRGPKRNIVTLKKSGLQFFYQIDLSDTAAVERVMKEHSVGLVIHFAANAFASESVARPLLYFHNVTQNTLSVLEAMASAGVSRLLYSSSCATYGEPGPADVPVVETTPQRPVSPYGVSKKLSEDIIRSTAAAYAKSGSGTRLHVALLRYFNVIGADPAARVGPVPRPELAGWARVADACLDTAEGLRPRMDINGVDYLTPDGSVVRDYVHVSDLTSAHLAVLEAVLAFPASEPMADPLVYNIGAGQGNSVRELARACQQATGVSFEVAEHARRPGDPPYIVGDARKIYAELGWRAHFTNLTESLEHMWRWRQRLRGRTGGHNSGHAPPRSLSQRVGLRNRRARREAQS